MNITLEQWTKHQAKGPCKEKYCQMLNVTYLITRMRVWRDNILSSFSNNWQSNRTRAIWTILPQHGSINRTCSLSCKIKFWGRNQIRLDPVTFCSSIDALCTAEDGRECLPIQPMHSCFDVHFLQLYHRGAVVKWSLILYLSNLLRLVLEERYQQAPPRDLTSLIITPL